MPQTSRPTVDKARIHAAEHPTNVPAGLVLWRIIGSMWIYTRAATVPLALRTLVRFDFLNLTGEPLPVLGVCHAPLARPSNALPGLTGLRPDDPRSRGSPLSEDPSLVEMVPDVCDSVNSNPTRVVQLPNSKVAVPDRLEPNGAVRALANICVFAIAKPQDFYARSM